MPDVLAFGPNRRCLARWRRRLGGTRSRSPPRARAELERLDSIFQRVATSGNRFAAHRKEGVESLRPSAIHSRARSTGSRHIPRCFPHGQLLIPRCSRTRPPVAAGGSRESPQRQREKLCVRCKSPGVRAQPGSAKTGLSRRSRGFESRRSRLLKYLHIKRLRCLAGRIGASRGAAFAARHACVPETARRKFLQVARPQAVSRGDSRQLFAETRSCWPSSIKRPIPASERLGALHGIRRTPRGVRQPARAGLAHARHGSCVVCRTTRSRSGAQPPAASGCRGERSRSPARRVRRAPRIRLGRHGRTRRTVPRAGLRR
jgi:hypothetical protein